MKNRKQKLAEILGSAVAPTIGEQAHRTFSRGQILAIVGAALLVFFVVEWIEYSAFRIKKDAIEAAAILRVCPPLRMPAQMAEQADRR